MIPYFTTRALRSILLLLGILFSHVSTGQGYTILKDIEAGSSVPLVAVYSDTIADVVLERSTNKVDSVYIWLSPFKDANGTIKNFNLVNSDSVTVVKGSFHKLSIATGKLAVDDEYQGYIIIEKGGEEIDRLTLRIKRLPAKRTSSIKVDRSNYTIRTSEETERFSFMVYEESGERTIVGLTMRLKEDEQSDRYIDLKDVSLKVRGMENINIRPDGNTVYFQLEEGKSVIIDGEIRNLSVGSNVLKLELSALNAPTESNPTIRFEFKVKHHWIWAVVVLIASILFTVVAKKVVAIRGARIQLRKKAIAINDSLPPLMPYNAATIRVKRILKMVLNIRRKTYSDFSELEKDLTVAEALAKYLTRSAKIYDRIRKLPEGMGKRRAQKSYSGILKYLASNPLDDAHKLDLENKIAELESWFADEMSFAEKYNADLSKDISSLMSVFNIQSFEKEYQVGITKIKDLLDDEGSNKEDIYAILKILWERRKDPNLEEILSSYTEDQNTERALELSDQVNWNRLQDANNRGELNFILPKVSSDTIETFRAIHFEIAPDDTKLGDNYLFKHGLEYHWKIQIKDKGVLVREIQEVTSEPKITQFSPVTGSISAEVEVKYYPDRYKHVSEGIVVEQDQPDYEPLKIVYSPDPAKNIVQSSATQITRSASVNELITTLSAAFVAVLAGISSYYLGVEVFGTAQDYILLFLSGAGIEQGTTFLTYLNKDS